MEFVKKKAFIRNMVFSGILLLLSVALTAIIACVFTSDISLFKSNLLELGIFSLLVFAVLEIFFLYIFYQVGDIYKKWKNVVLVVAIIFVTLIVSIGCMRYIDPFVAPIAMSAVLVAMLVSNRVGFMANAFTTILTMATYVFLEYIVSGRFAVVAMLGLLISLIQSYCMMFLIKRNYTRMKLTWGALIVGVVSAPVAMLVSVIVYKANIVDIAYAGLWSFVGNTISVGLFTAMLPIYESVFDIWTNFKLADACSLSRPLLKRLLTEASGTFNHSLVVSNLAESCALSIGENPYLAKACAIYHDIGKLSNPEFFVENQSDYNPHNDLIPEESVRLITKHTIDGYKLLKEMRMPEEIALVAKEHQGTSPVMFFYNKVQKITERGLDVKDFRYPGPKPSSKISAVVMIADVVEATTRARKPKDKEELLQIIDELIQQKINEGQFDQCDITFKDLEVIKQTMVKVVPGIFHDRISYGDDKKIDKTTNPTITK